MTDTKDKAMTGQTDWEALSLFNFATIIQQNTGMVNGCVDTAARSIWKLVEAYIEETENRIIDAEFAKTEAENRLTTPPAPQAEVEIGRPSQYVVDKQDDGHFRLSHLFNDGHKICIAISPGDSYGDELDLKVIAQAMNKHKSAALRSAQAPAPAKGEMVARAVLDAVEKTWGQSSARTYADGIEDAAKVVQDFPAGNQYVPPTRKHLAQAIRVLITKPAHVSGKEDDNA